MAQVETKTRLSPLVEEGMDHFHSDMTNEELAKALNGYRVKRRKMDLDSIELNALIAAGLRNADARNGAVTIGTDGIAYVIENDLFSLGERGGDSDD